MGFVWLVVKAPPGGSRPVLAFYGWTILQMFVFSAVFHLRRWSDRGWALMRKIDHIGIFLLIGGSNGAIVGLGAEGSAQAWVPAAALGLIAVGIVVRLSMRHPPFGLMNSVFLIVGGVGLFAVPSILRNLGVLATVLIMIGAFLYVLGALCLGARRPNPWPGKFGYHEFWHLLVIASVALHYTVVARWILPRL